MKKLQSSSRPVVAARVGPAVEVNRLREPHPTGRRRECFGLLNDATNQCQILHGGRHLSLPSVIPWNVLAYAMADASG